MEEHQGWNREEDTREFLGWHLLYLGGLRVLGRKVETSKGWGSIIRSVCLLGHRRLAILEKLLCLLESLGAELRLVGWNSLVCKSGTNTIMTSRLDIATTPASELADCTPLIAFSPSSYREPYA